MLTLADVLTSAEASHPLIESELARLRQAEAEARAASGRFDPVLEMQGSWAALGYYDYGYGGVSVRQPTGALGATVYGGYRLSRGTLPIYEGRHETLGGGEVRFGARLPLLRDFGIDARRAGLEVAERATEAADAQLAAARLSILEEAALAYLSSVVARQQLEVQEELTRLAEARNSQIAAKTEVGALPPVELDENRRALMTRRTALIAARRKLESANLKLALFLRGRSGEAVIVSPDVLPRGLESPLVDALPGGEADVTRALAQRPELRKYRALAEQLRVKLDLARNQVLPRLDVSAEVADDFGSGSEAAVQRLDEPTGLIAVTFDMPLTLREPRAKRDAAAAELQALERELQFARDKVRIDVLDAASALRAASERAQAAHAAWQAAEIVARGERERFELGATMLLMVNLREQAAADAKSSLVEAIAEAHWGRMRYRLALGEPPDAALMAIEGC